MTKGLDAIEMMNAAGYDVVTLGNHEFDYGYTQLKDNMTKANPTKIKGLTFATNDAFTKAAADQVEALRCV